MSRRYAKTSWPDSPGGIILALILICLIKLFWVALALLGGWAVCKILVWFVKLFEVETDEQRREGQASGD